MMQRRNQEPSSTERLLAGFGWGYVTIDPSSIQADNGAGLTRGIIGLVNKGQPRKPEDWGSPGHGRGELRVHSTILKQTPLWMQKRWGLEGGIPLWESCFGYPRF